MIKRLFDILFSLMVIVLSAPFILLVAVLIKLYDRGPVFYMAPRVGLNGKMFRMYKFRSMVVNADKLGPSSTANDDKRLTGVGRFLRKYKLDEMPQMFNVLLGDMSIVGPRPQIKWAVDQYNEEEKKILSIKPGITDYASIRFHNEGEILAGAEDPDKAYMELIHPEKMRLSLLYLQQRSLATDMKIIWQTFLKLFR